MCWSPNVTLFFVSFELVCCTILAFRRQRLLLIALGPLVLQEVGQLWLWWSIEADEVAGTCSMSNIHQSIFELIIVLWLLPTCGAVAGLISLAEFERAASKCCTASVCVAGPAETHPSEEGQEEAVLEETTTALLAESGGQICSSFDQVTKSYTRLRLRSRQDRAFLALTPPLALFFSLLGGGLWVCGAYAGWPNASWCTTRGAHGGHQLWPWVQPPLPPIVQSFFDSWGMLIAELFFCWWLRRLPASFLHGTHACRWVTHACSSALTYLLVYFPVWSIYMGLAAYGIAVLLYRGERLVRVAPNGVTTNEPAQRLVGPQPAVLPVSVHYGWLGCLAVLAAGPAITVPAWMLWGPEYGSVWCWSASLALVAAVFEPWATAHALRHYERAAALTTAGSVQLGTAGRGKLQPTAPFWQLALRMSFSPEQRVHDWMCHGPLRQCADSNRANSSTAGPLDLHGGSSHALGTGGGRSEQAGCVPAFNRKLEAWLDAIGSAVEQHM
eukprot:CAMPEP_0115852208 /NCGR_PEP_ID=MMETSP0287-20121206/12878_1 /TAXON_ID=412157 /ORGANISM="Chrysochromulina rotalis, Strain UIO044" /LENGTH=498 /DNA_ID=CAMNT_0003306263 /DNA_START=25 /DNA_END=1521 /DNA_ORIENTATION=-